MAIIGEIRPFAFGKVPNEWALCDGKVMKIVENVGLFSLLGNVFGGDGESTFALPDLRGRVPVHEDGQTMVFGAIGGSEDAVLTSAMMPAHTHVWQAVAEQGNKAIPEGKLVAGDATMPMFHPAENLVAMHAGAISSSGGDQQHNNMQPSLVVNYCICLEGSYPGSSPIDDVEPILGEIRMFAANYAPRGWAMCDGGLLEAASNKALSNLIGAAYGGDGKRTFALPDLRGRLAIGQGDGPGLSSRRMGEEMGEEMVSLWIDQMPSHRHQLSASEDTASEAGPDGNMPAVTTSQMYGHGDNPVLLNGSALQAVGSGQPHENRQPSIAISFIIATTGIYPQPGNRS